MTARAPLFAAVKMCAGLVHSASRVKSWHTTTVSTTLSAFPAAAPIVYARRSNNAYKLAIRTVTAVKKNPAALSDSAQAPTVFVPLE